MTASLTLCQVSNPIHLRVVPRRHTSVTPSKPATFVEAGDLTLGFPEFGALLKILSLVAVSLALSKTQLDLYPATLEVEVQADEGEAFLLGGLGEFENLVFVQEEFSGPLGFVLKKRASGLPGLDIAAVEPAFASFDPGKGLGNAHLAIANRLHLGPSEG